jgi:hypothetical protein
MRRLLLFVLGLASFIPTAFAAELFLLTDHPLHEIDKYVVETVGQGDAKILHIAELASITPEQARKRTSYQRIGCEPFTVQQESKIIDEGYNCRTFFCVGYRTGAKVCKTHEGKIYSGVMEINRRMTLVSAKEERLDFSKIASPTTPQRARLEELASLACEPFYILHWDIAVGEGYRCTEIGKYPDFSPAVECINDWRDPRGYICNPEMSNEQLQARSGIAQRFGIVSRTSSSSKSSLSSSGSIPTGFSDVISGYYGYTAILSLAEQGVVKGYPDGTFRPKDSVNRAEFLKMLMAGLFPDKLENDRGCFPDVARQWFTSYVCGAKKQGWVGGYGDGMFRPGQTMRKSEGIKIIIAALGVPLESTAPLPKGASSGDWYTPYVRKAVELRILLEPSLDPNAWATRADTAVWMYRASKAMLSPTEIGN